MDFINKTIKSFAIKSNLSNSMISRIDIISELFDEILIISNKKLYDKIVDSLTKIFSDHSKNDSQIKLLSDVSDGHKKLYEGFCKHYFGGESFKKPDSPKPERP